MGYARARGTREMVMTAERFILFVVVGSIAQVVECSRLVLYICMEGSVWCDVDN